MAAARQTGALQDFLLPLYFDTPKVAALAKGFCKTYKELAAESKDQFLPTPISESLLSPSAARGGRYLAIDIGGTNLRVGFIELSAFNAGSPDVSTSNGAAKGSLLHTSRVYQTLEKSWPIGEQLKHEKAEDLFAWIGDRIAEVVEDGVEKFGSDLPSELPLGVTFSFPMIQHTLSDATLMSMGKGFAITSNLDLGKQLRDGYAKARASRNLPNVKLVAIVNDTVATLIAFSYQLKSSLRHKAAMGLVVGTGTNATIPLELESLHRSKRPKADDVAGSIAEAAAKVKVVVNTEWSIKGAAGPLRDLDLITRWDKSLDAAGSAPGFQPFEYMTAGRYLGELGRLIILEYFTTELQIPREKLPPKLCQSNGLSTTFLGSLKGSSISVLDRLSQELPSRKGAESWQWTQEAAGTVVSIAKAIELRAAGMTASAIIGLLACAGEITLIPETTETHTNGSLTPTNRSALLPVEDLIVGYTGLCIENFQDFLRDCQLFLNQVMDAEFENQRHPRIVLQAFHDGGLIGAGVLAGTATNLEMAV